MKDAASGHVELEQEGAVIKSAIGMMLAFIIAGSADAQSQSVFPPAQPYNPLAGFEQGYDMSQRIVRINERGRTPRLCRTRLRAIGRCVSNSAA